MARVVLILLSASLVFAGCSCDDDDPKPNLDGGTDAGQNDGSMDSSMNEDSGSDATTTTDAANDSATADAAPDATSDDDAGYDAGPGPRNACGGEMCDLLSATSCDNNESCLFLISDPNPIPFAQCEPAGTATEGQACTSPYDCAPGLDCTSDGSAGTCRSYCCNLNQKSGCPGEQACVLEFLDDNDDPTGVGLCDECDECNPLDSAGTCNGNVGCYPIPGNDGRTFSDCTLCLPSTMNLTVGERCRSVNDCGPGLGCFRLNNRAPVCVAMCDLGASSDPCDGPATCQDRLGAASIGGTVGACVQ